MKIHAHALYAEVRRRVIAERLCIVALHMPQHEAGIPTIPTVKHVLGVQKLGAD